MDDPSFLPVIFAADPKDDWTSPATWKKANPTYPDSPKHEYLETKCKRAQETPGLENTFKNLHCNLWTDAESRWIGSQEWAKNEGPNLIDDGAPCFAGLDLASTDDIAAFVAAFPVEEQEMYTAEGKRKPPREYRIHTHFWIPEDNIAQRIRRHRVPYDVWAREGWLTLTDGNVIDYTKVRSDIVAFAKRYQVKELAYDPWNAQQLVTQLEEEDKLKMVLMRQGFVTLTGPTKETGKLVRAGRLRTGGNPVLRWMAGNVVVVTDDAENLKPSKKKSREKIDGIAALIMALGRAVLHSQRRSVYQERGIRTL